MTAARPHPLFNALTPGSAFRQYRLLEQIGVGGQGVVWSAVDQAHDQIHAIKFSQVLDSADVEAEALRDELQLKKLTQLMHPYILPVLEYGFDAQMRFTVSPYVPGGTLTQKIRLSPLAIQKIISYGMEIASALDYLHSQGIIHRDLKSENILLDLRQNCYLADFGLARLVSTSTLAFHTGHGTPPYAPPEQIQSRAITPRSDIFSFGILLYEMFTGQLPWNGKKQLGMEQLNSKQELPDPREFNENLPPLLTDVLRRVTSASPELRPSSAGEIMRAIQRIFNVAPEPAPEGNNIEDRWMVLDGDVAEMLQRAFVQWKSTDETYNLGLTKFALVNLKREKINMDMYSHFMLSQALTYAYQDDFWWLAVRDPKERLAVSSQLLKKHNEVITGRVVARLTSDPNIAVLKAGLPESITTTLLETGIKTDNAFLRREIFDGLRTLTQPRHAWGDTSLNPEQTQRLGWFALEDSEFGDTAAELIGHLRSAAAVKTVLRQADEERKIAILLLIQRASGNLPAFVPRNLRFRLSLEWVLRRLLQEPVSLIGAYALALLGAALGIGLQVFVTYRLPSLLDTARITDSIVQGLVVGAVFGLGIFSIRVVMERFRTSKVLLRTFIATILGGGGLNIALLIFHVLFLDTPPGGFLITTACLLIALTFAVGSLFRARLLRMFLSSLSIFAAIIGTWWLHTQYAASLSDLTPVLRYDYAWTLTQVAFTALGIALPIGVFGNLINLSIAEE